MRLRLPKSLAGQTVGVLLLALTVSHVIGLIIYAVDRRQVVVNTEAHDLADRVVGMVLQLQRLPAQWRQDIVRGADGRNFYAMLGSAPDIVERDLDEDLSQEVARYVRTQFPTWAANRIRVGMSDVPLFDIEKILGNQSIREPETSLNLRNTQPTYDYLHISIELEAGEWLNLVGALSRPPLLRVGSAVAYIVSLAIGVALFTVWLLRRVTAPLGEFGRAADRLGKDIRAEPLAEAGPIEIVEAARAFNAMQERLTRYLQNRSQMLAAISHDLRTPMTLLRLRAEAIADRQEGSKLLLTLEEMEAMIASVLEFTRATVLDEPQSQVDLSALVGSVCDDLTDAGGTIEFEPPATIPYNCRRMSLKRAFTNLIENAVKYGSIARVRLVRGDGEIHISIEDEGPGIPADMRELVFMPFQRIDNSRNADTGGVGLGLSIAQTIVHGHGGQVTLENRPEGGLRVGISLPV